MENPEESGAHLPPTALQSKACREKELMATNGETHKNVLSISVNMPWLPPERGTVSISISLWEKLIFGEVSKAVAMLAAEFGTQVNKETVDKVTSESSGEILLCYSLWFQDQLLEHIPPSLQ